jgi:hypothetical protein
MKRDPTSTATKAVLCTVARKQLPFQNPIVEMSSFIWSLPAAKYLVVCHDRVQSGDSVSRRQRILQHGCEFHRQQQFFVCPSRTSSRAMRPPRSQGLAFLDVPRSPIGFQPLA